MSSIIVKSSTYKTESNTFNIDQDIFLTKMKVNEKQGKSVGILNKNSRKQLYINVPEMMTWGVSKFVDPDGKKDDTFSVNLQFPKKDEMSGEVSNFFNLMQDLENKLIKHVIDNSKEFTGKQMSEEVVMSKWTPILKYPKDLENKPDAAPVVRVKLPVYDGKAGFELWDSERNMIVNKTDYLDGGTIDENCIRKHATVKSIIKFSGIWFVGGNISATISLHQGIVNQPDFLEDGVCHIDDDEEGGEYKSKGSKTQTYDTDDEQEPSTEKMDVEESNDEQEENGEQEDGEQEDGEQEDPESEPEPEPEPLPEPVKKSRKRQPKA